MASNAEFYSQNLATEVMKGLRQMALQGGTPGRAPFGYLNERRFDAGRAICTITIDPGRAEHVIFGYAAIFHIAAREHLGEEIPKGVAPYPTLVAGQLPEHVIGGRPLGFRSAVTLPPDGTTQPRPSGSCSTTSSGR